VSQKPQIDYYYSAISSFAYLGHWAFLDLIKRLSCEVTYRPVQLGNIFAGSGGLGLGDRHPARLRYRLLELQRWRAKRNLEMNLQPKFFPTNPALADCAAIALQAKGHDPSGFMGTIMRDVWVNEQNIAQEEVVAAALAASGFEADEILASAKAADSLALYDANTAKGKELDIIGSPCVVYQGEAFWGQDRFELLEEAIISGRGPFTAG
jgi:2-hydroxychromene-2-carboxylate isomerase